MDWLVKIVVLAIALYAFALIVSLFNDFRAALKGWKIDGVERIAFTADFFISERDAKKALRLLKWIARIYGEVTEEDYSYILERATGRRTCKNKKVGWRGEDVLRYAMVDKLGEVYVIRMPHATTLAPTDISEMGVM